MSAGKSKNIFVQGPISPQFIADAIAKHQSKTEIGAHDIFLGQIRADVIEGKTVTAIEYTAYEAMANEQMARIREAIFAEFQLTCMHVYHSLGTVAVGELCLFVFVSAPHRQAAFDGIRELVERIKKELPVFGRELFEDESYTWKVNR
jgi:molybdopterin synthase catalytic subunit